MVSLGLWVPQMPIRWNQIRSSREISFHTTVDGRFRNPTRVHQLDRYPTPIIYKVLAPSQVVVSRISEPSTVFCWIRWFQKSKGPRNAHEKRTVQVTKKIGVYYTLAICRYHPVNKHSNGKSPSWIGNTSSNGGFSIAMLDYRSVPKITTSEKKAPFFTASFFIIVAIHLKVMFVTSLLTSIAGGM